MGTSPFVYRGEPPGQKAGAPHGFLSPGAGQWDHPQNPSDLGGAWGLEPLPRLRGAAGLDS